ncbi:MAG: hypothetical protein HY337_11925 [Gemmatimonadetes bacterium]|nr:hypothetical protein [Gemmatimonadota bacterium]
MRAAHLAKQAATALAVSVLTAAGLTAQDMRLSSASRQRGAEPDINVHVRFGVGRFQLKPGREDALYRARLQYDAEAFEPIMRYDPLARRMTMGIEGLNRHGRGWDRDNPPEQWLNVELSPAVPADLELEFGAGTADVELGGLSVRRAHIKVGAAESVIRFSEPNRVTCEALTFEAGAIDLKTEHLGNARCGRIEFKGAAGDITLDLTGAWPENSVTELDVTSALSAVTLLLPERLGVSVEMDRFLASFDRAGLRKRGNRYYSASYDTASAKLNVDVKTGIGSVEVRWVR